MRNRLLSSVWGLIVLGSLLYAGSRFWKGNAVDTSLLSLLPTSEGDPLVIEANQVLSQRATRLMAFVVGHPDAATADAINQELKEKLRQSPFIQTILTDPSPEQQRAFYDLYFPFRYQMLSPADRVRLKSGHALNDFAARLTYSLYSPAATLFKNLIAHDPFLFFPELMKSWQETAAPRPSTSFPEGISYVDSDGYSYAFTAIQLAQDPFDSKNQDAMMSWIADLRKETVRQWPQSHLYLSGALPFATAERLRTESEMKMISIGSLAGVLLLALAIFASLRTLFLAALPISVGFVTAVSATLLCFGKIHIITFAFGSSLIGVAIDSPLLYLATHRMAGSQWNGREALRQIQSSLLLGDGTTLMGYAALSVAPFPGLRQMALFSSVGLMASLITVLLWLPTLLPEPSKVNHEPWMLLRGQSFLRKAQEGRKALSRNQWMIGSLALVIFTIGGLLKLRFDDDIHRLQHPPETVAKEDAFVQKAAGGFGGNRFILMRGATVEDLLERQELLQEKLHPLLASGVLTSIQSLAPFLPSWRRQQEDRELLRTALSEGDRVRHTLNEIGLTKDISNRVLADLRAPLKVFSVEDWLSSPASQLTRSLWIGSTAHGFVSVALAGGLSEPAQLKASLASMEGVQFFDQVEEYTSLFRRYRHLSMALLLAGYLCVWAFVSWRFGLRRGVWVTAPSLFGVLATFALFGWCGVSLNIIHCLSALLVLSMGVDYPIYFAESVRNKRPIGPTLLAVELCACCALLSFGLLALCRTPVLSSVGITVFPGMLIACLLSPLPYWTSGV